MGGLKVLLTNSTLDLRAGTELYVRDLALGLLRRGHTPIAYSTRVGDAGRELRRATVPVVEDLRQIASPPDIIHGQHHAETMTALLHFRDAPAVFFCHGWLPPEEAPPRFPRILRYVAVDDTCRDRLLCEHGIAEARVRVQLNFVDLERFPPRPPLPSRPRRALVFSNYANEATHLPAVREACARARIALDVMGRRSGQPSDAPEKSLGRYDLIFAKGRSALEALAVGAAVVLCDEIGAGPLVTSDEAARLRRLNFGIRALRGAVSADALATQIARYDAGDAAEVSRWIRARAGLEDSLDEIVALYEEVLAEHRAAGPPDAEAEGRAAADYLRWAQTDIWRERESFKNSAVIRLRDRLLAAPLLGPTARALSRKLSR